MKQQPTKEEWNELSNENKLHFWSKFLKDDETISVVDIEELAIPTLGQIIEFLGDDLWQIQRDKGGWVFILMCNKDKGHTGKCLNGEFVAKELIDAAFEAVKEKLK